MAGFEGAVAYDILPRILAAYRPRFPSVKLVLEQLGTAAQTATMCDERIDVGFLCPEGRDPALLFETVAREPYRAVLPAGHPLASRGRVPLTALADEDFVLFPRATGVVAYDQIISICEGVGFSPRVTQEAVRYVTIVALVSAGLGVSLVPACVENFRRDGVVFRPLKGRVLTLERMMAWRHDAHSEVLAEFLDVVRATSASTTCAR
ncbi:MAG: LysR family substrate-binding domain-containing protein [Chloroflexota bacterium]|nr:LysR family substrate-binding domain-containing protein [Chloroflexota bacterium]